MFNKKKTAVSFQININSDGEINFFVDLDKTLTNTDIVANVLFKINTGQYRDSFLNGIEYYCDKNQNSLISKEIIEKYICLENTYNTLINENKYLLDRLKNNGRNPLIPPNQALDVLRSNL